MPSEKTYSALGPFQMFLKSVANGDTLFLVSYVHILDLFSCNINLTSPGHTDAQGNCLSHTDCQSHCPGNIGCHKHCPDQTESQRHCLNHADCQEHCLGHTPKTISESIGQQNLSSVDLSYNFTTSKLFFLQMK